MRPYELDLFNINIPLATQEEALALRYKKRNTFITTFRKPKRWGFADTHYPEPHFHFDKKAIIIGEDFVPN